MLPEDFKTETDSILEASKSLVEEIFLSLQAEEKYRKALHRIIDAKSFSSKSLKQIAWEALDG